MCRRVNVWIRDGVYPTHPNTISGVIHFTPPAPPVYLFTSHDSCSAIEGESIRFFFPLLFFFSLTSSSVATDYSSKHLCSIPIRVVFGSTFVHVVISLYMFLYIDVCRYGEGEESGEYEITFAKQQIGEVKRETEARKTIFSTMYISLSTFVCVFGGVVYQEEEKRAAFWRCTKERKF